MAHERSLAFYEVVEQVEGGLQKLDSNLPWDKAIQSLDAIELPDRTHTFDRITLGARLGIDGDSVLVLHKVRKDTDWTSLADFNNNTIEELVAKSGQGYLDTSLIYFVPETNRLALLRGGLSAPTHTTLRDWLNSMQLFDDIRFDVRPVMQESQIQELQKAAVANRAEFRFRDISRIGKPKGAIARAAKELGDHYGEGASVTLSVTLRNVRNVPDGAPDPKKLLLQDVQEVLPELDEQDRANAGLLFQDGDSYTKQRVVSLLEHHFTASVRMPSDNGSAGMHASARLMITEADAVSKDLQAAVVDLE